MAARDDTSRAQGDPSRARDVALNALHDVADLVQGAIRQMGGDPDYLAVGELVGEARRQLALSAFDHLADEARAEILASAREQARTTAG